MPKYFPFKICGYYLYFTAHCVVECMHVHASNEELTEPGSAKFFVRSDGSSKLTARGRLKDREIVAIQKFIKDNYETMYATWRTLSANGFYEKINNPMLSQPSPPPHAERAAFCVLAKRKAAATP